MVVKKEGVKSRTKLNSNKDFYKKLAVIGIIVVLIMGIFLFVNLRGVGKAVETKSWQSLDDCDYFNAFGAFTEDLETDCASPNCWSGGIEKCITDKTVVNCDATLFCNNGIKTYCAGGGDKNPDIIQGTIFNDDAHFYCGNNNNWYPCELGLIENNPANTDTILCDYKADKKPWILCNAESEGSRGLDNKFYCQKSPPLNVVWKWKECTFGDVDKNSGDDKYYCDGTQWKLITAQNPGQLSNQYVTQDKTYICSQTENKNGIQNAMYCDDSKYLWYPCNQYNKFSISLNKKAYCGDEEWSFCVEKEILPSVNDAAPNKGQFLCDDSVNTWLTCTKTTTNKLMFLDQFYCNLDATSQKWGWETCSGVKGYLSKDQTKFCIDSKWVECTQAGINPKKSNYYCDGKLWQTCDISSNSKVVKEAGNKYWQCNAVIWTEQTCTFDKKVEFINDLSTNLPIFRCDGKYWASYTYLDEDVKLGLGTDYKYEVFLTKNIKIKSVAEYDDNGGILGATYDGLTLCDKDDAKNPGFVTLCYSNEGTKVTLEKNKANTDYLAPFFLYNGYLETQKSASVILKIDGTQDQIKLSEENLFAGQRLVIDTGDDMYYLLSYKPAENNYTDLPTVSGGWGDFFDLGSIFDNFFNPQPKIEVFEIAQLKLKSIKFASKDYLFTKISNNCIYTDMEGSKKLTICLEEGGLNIYPYKKIGAMVAEEIPVNLNDIYESQVSNLQSIKVIAPTNTKKMIYLCDQESLVWKADICYTSQDGKEIIDKDNIFSLKELSTNPKETLKTYSDLTATAIYENEVDNPTEKVVKLILTKNIASDAFFDKNIFSENLRKGRRLVFKIGTENYILSHPIADSTDESKFVLKHLPTLKEYPNSGKVFLTSKSVNGVQFQVQNSKVITIYQQGNSFFVTSALSKEISTTYAEAQEIGNYYELNFNKNSPVKIGDLNNALVTVCSSDNSLDSLNFFVCVLDHPQFTLNINTPAVKIINNKNLVLLYQVDNTSKKQGYLFNLHNLILNSKNLDYNNFINNLAGAGRRLSLKFSENLYLIKHTYPLDSADPFFRMKQLSLSFYKDGAKTDIPSSGSEKKVTFSLPDGGRITLERELDITPPPPFHVFAQTKQEIADIPVNLTEQLYTTFTSESPIKITSPSLGVVHSNDGADYKKVEAFFKIKLDGLNQQITLSKDVPYVLSNNNLLFYYDQAYFVGDLPIKTVKVYWMTNLANNNYHDLNNDFIDTFTSGNELALKFDKSYYLLGYDGASSNTKQFFKENKVSLRRLNDSQAYSSKITEEGITYLVPEGKIIVKFDYSHNQIIFSKTLQSDVITEEFLIDEYSHQLTTKNKVKVGDITLSICSQKIYGDMPNVAGVCANDKLLKDQPLENYGTFSFGNEPYLLEVNSEIGDQKVVTIRKIGPITTTGKTLDDWESFSQHLMDKDQPIVNLSGDLYLPSAEDSQLKNFGMQEYDQIGITYPENLMMKKAGVFNGTFVLKDKLLFVEQTLVAADQRSISLKLEDYKIVPYYGEWELNGLGASLVTKINGKKYFFWEDSVSFPGLIDFSIVDSSSGKFIIHKYFKIGDIKYVTLDGVQIKIEFITKNKVPTVLISRP